MRAFWEAEPCGSVHSQAPEGSREYFEEVERQRYEAEPFITGYADFASTRGRTVLEIGVGMGTDHVNFARAGARLSGIDLTEHGVSLVRQRLALEGLESDLQVGDAERLPYADGSFEVVYSWGVLHHTPDSTRAISEAVRVLAPGGRLCVMLYARHSWVVYGLWLRFGPLKGRPTRSLADVLAHHMESPGTKGYTKAELRALFSGIEDLEIEKVATPYDRLYARKVADLTGSKLGFFTVIRGHKP